MSKRIEVTLVLIVKYVNWPTRDSTNFSVFREVYINLSKVGDGDLDRISWVPVHDCLCRHASMQSSNIVVANYPYQGSSLREGMY